MWRAGGLWVRFWFRLSPAGCGFRKGGGSEMTKGMPSSAPHPGHDHLVETACPLDCPDSCSLTVTVREGRVVKVDGSAPRP